MTIKSNTGESITFDHIHLSSFSMVQSETDEAKKKVTMVCKRYGFTAEGAKVFDGRPITLNFVDFDSFAIEMRMADGVAMEDLQADQAAAVAKVAGFNIFESMKGFEVGVGEALKYKNRFDYSAVE